MSNQTTDLKEDAEKFIDAYNSGDLGRLEAAFGEDAALTHHNRGGDVGGTVGDHGDVRSVGADDAGQDLR
ncbi:hypothetical protein QM646_03240 [Rhodococcus erythropolis]|nr:hypothetical protein [Rhodococcus erythropolis]